MRIASGAGHRLGKEERKTLPLEKRRFQERQENWVAEHHSVKELRLLGRLMGRIDSPCPALKRRQPGRDEEVALVCA
jgi:hypothetical protein